MHKRRNEFVLVPLSNSMESYMNSIEVIPIRNEILHALDLERFIEFFNNVAPLNARPSHKDVYEIMMHKLRRNLPQYFSEAERSHSYNWLAYRGYTTQISLSLEILG